MHSLSGAEVSSGSEAEGEEELAGPFWDKDESAKFINISDIYKNLRNYEVLKNYIFNIIDTYTKQVGYFLNHINTVSEPINNFENAIKVLKIAINE